MRALAVPGSNAGSNVPAIRDQWTPWTTDPAQPKHSTRRLHRPGPKLIERVADALAVGEEERPAGVRTHEFDYAEMLKDTPELLERTGDMTSPGTEMSYALADVINAAVAYDDDDSE